MKSDFVEQRAIKTVVSLEASALYPLVSHPLSKDMTIDRYMHAHDCYRFTGNLVGVLADSRRSGSSRIPQGAADVHDL
jgi:hypothetical protein